MSFNSKVPTINKIFDDLDAYREFCRDYGFVFNEKHLYDSKAFPYIQFERLQRGLPIVDGWDESKKEILEREKRALYR